MSAVNCLVDRLCIMISGVRLHRDDECYYNRLVDVIHRREFFEYVAVLYIKVENMRQPYCLRFTSTEGYLFFDRNCRGLCLVMVVSDARIINAMVWWAINSRGGKWRLLRVLVRKGHFVAQVQGSARKWS